MMQLTDTISIILPVYNSENKIRKCLDSLVDQTYKNLEFIFIIDGSPDQSLAIVREYQARDSRIIIQDLPENIGVAGARNCGIQLATGEFICFVDPDDFIDANLIELLAAKLDNSVDLVIAGLLREFEGNNEVYCHLPDFSLITAEIQELKPFYSALERHDLLFSLLNKVFRRSLIYSNNICFIPLSLGEDHCFVLTYLAHCQRIKVCQISGYHYIHYKGATLSHGIQRASSAIKRFLDEKFRLQNIFLRLIGLPEESRESFFIKNLLAYNSLVTSLFSPVFPVPSSARKKQLRAFRKLPGIAHYKKQSMGLRFNLMKIPLCYLPVWLADFLLNKAIRYHFAHK